MADLNQILLSSKISRIEPSVSKPTSAPKEQSGAAFESALDRALSGAEIHLSKHAQKRLEARQIELSSTERAKLSNAFLLWRKKEREILWY